MVTRNLKPLKKDIKRKKTLRKYTKRIFPCLGSKRKTSS